MKDYLSINLICICLDFITLLTPCVRVHIHLRGTVDSAHAGEFRKTSKEYFVDEVLVFLSGNNEITHVHVERPEPVVVTADTRIKKTGLIDKITLCVYTTCKQESEGGEFNDSDNCCNHNT